MQQNQGATRSVIIANFAPNHPIEIEFDKNNFDIVSFLNLSFLSVISIKMLTI